MMFHSYFRSGLSGVAPKPGFFNRPRGLDEGERALIALVVTREAGRMDLARQHAERAASALRDSFAVALLLEEGLPSPLTGRLGALATAAGILASDQPRLGRFERRRLASNGVDADELLDLIATVAEVSSHLFARQGRDA